MDRWICAVCGYAYDPVKGVPEQGNPAGTAFEDLSGDFACPVCGMDRDMFEVVLDGNLPAKA